MEENRCSLCRGCSFESSIGEFVCHNEDSKLFGEKILDELESTCDKFDKHLLRNISVDDAVDIISSISSNGTRCAYKLPDNDFASAHLTLSFKSNKDMDDFRDAYLKLQLSYVDRQKN